MLPHEYEWDAIWMTLVVFIPSVFALGLLFFPRGQENAMRWWSLIGTALTLALHHVPKEDKQPAMAVFRISAKIDARHTENGGIPID